MKQQQELWVINAILQSKVYRIFTSFHMFLRNCFNSFMHNVVKWPNILLKSCGVNTVRFLRHVWSFCNVMHERVEYFQDILAAPKI